MAEVIRAVSDAIEKHGLLAVLIVAIVIGGFLVLRVLGEMSRSISDLTGKQMVENAEAMKAMKYSADLNTESNHIAAQRMTVLSDSINRLADSHRDICRSNAELCQAEAVMQKLKGQFDG